MPSKSHSRKFNKTGTPKFAKKCPLYSEQPTKFFADFVRCKLRGVAKIAVRGIAKVVRARFYHGAKIRLLLIFALVVNLLGSAFPKPCFVLADFNSFASA